VFENRVLREISWHKREVVRGYWTNLRSREDPHHLLCTSDKGALDGRGTWHVWREK